MKASTSLWLDVCALVASSVRIYNERFNTTNPTQNCLLVAKPILGQLASGSAIQESVTSYEQMTSTLQIQPLVGIPEYSFFLYTWQWQFPMEA
jgi:hypothetical protein